MSSNYIPSGVLNEGEVETADGGLKTVGGRFAAERTYKLVWRNIILATLVHIFAFCGLWTVVTGKVKWQTNLFGKSN
jgi:hypothetical protein